MATGVHGAAQDSSGTMMRSQTTTLPRGLRLHPRFLDAFLSLPASLKDPAIELAQRLCRPVPDIRNLKGCKPIQGIAGGQTVYECRIDRGYRLSFMLGPGGVPYMLLVGHHDDLVNDTIRLVRSGVDLPTDAPPSVDVAVRTPDERRRTRPATPEIASPLRTLSDDLLQQMGVPAPLIPAVRGIADPDEIIRVTGLPKEAELSLVAYLVDGTIMIPGVSNDQSATEAVAAVVRRARAEGGTWQHSGSSQLGLTRELLAELEIPEGLIPDILRATSWEAIEELPLKVRQTMRLAEAVTAHAVTGVAPSIQPDHVVASAEELEQYYTGEIRQLLLHLTEEQQPLLELRTDQLHLLKGVAGSGKTTVAIYRARRVVQESSSARVLFVTYTKTLAATARELVAELTPAEMRTRIEVTHLHGWMSGYLGSGRFGVMSDKGRLQIMEQVLEATRSRSSARSRVLDRSASWFLAEISESIKGRGVRSLSEYLGLDRTGRETALPEAARRAVWAVYEQYQHNLGPSADWDDIPLRCLERLAKDPARPQYDFVIVDEAQDLSPVALRLVAALTFPERPAGMIVADAAQSIYRRGFRWRDIGITVHGSQVHRLPNNHRNTMQILTAANALLAGRPELRDDGDGALADLNAPRHGPRPRVLLCDSFPDEVRAIGEDLQRMRREKGIRWANAAVLSPTYGGVLAVLSELKKLGIPVVGQRDSGFGYGADAVKVLTLHSAKGLEFPVVYICDCTAGSLPRDPEAGGNAEEHDDRERRLLYVGMTRAMHELVLTGKRDSPSPYILEVAATLEMPRERDAQTDTA